MKEGGREVERGRLKSNLARHRARLNDPFPSEVCDVTISSDESETGPVDSGAESPFRSSGGFNVTMKFSRV